MCECVAGKCTSLLTQSKCGRDCQQTFKTIEELGLKPQNAVECFILFAVGTQNYECKSGDGVWELKEPNAVLFSSRGQCDREVVTSHYFLDVPDESEGKASWEGADGSRITVTSAALPVLSKVDSPDGVHNIPWLSTVKTSGVEGPVYGDIVAVVRAETIGGVAPAETLCDLVGKKTFVPYKSAYVFYAAA